MGDGSGLLDRAPDGFTDVLSDDFQIGFSAGDGVLGHGLISISTVVWMIV
jgi:hypothetical protein